MKKTALALLALLIVGPAWAAPERLDDVLADMRVNGYASVSGALERLQHVSDRPGAGAPLDQRLRYDTALLDLQQRAHLPAQADLTIAALERMATREHCGACRFEVAMAKSRRLLDEGTLDQLRPYLKQAQAALPAGDSGREQRLLGLLANQAALAGKYNNAIEMLVRASMLADRAGNRAEKLRFMGMMIWVNADMGDLDRAEALGREVLAGASAIDYRSVMGTAELDLGYVYSLKHDAPRQLAALTAALQLSENSPDLIDIKVLSLNNLADYYLGEPSQAQRVYDLASRANALAQAHDMARPRAAALANMGIAKARLGDPGTGIDLLKQAIALSEQRGIEVYVIGITMELVKAYQAIGRYHDALVQLQKADALQDKLTQQERKTAVLDLQEKYSAERKAQEIRQLSAENKLRQAQVAASTWQRRLWTALAGLFALGSIALTLMVRRTRSINHRLAIANATLAEQSMVDPLTGAYNRRHCDVLMNRLQATLRRRGEQAAADVTGLLIFDLDLFKQVNDTWGHAAGDAVLVAIVKRLRDLVREQDVVARWGGEEFILLLPHTGAAGLRTMAWRVLQAIADTPVMFEGQAIPITVSIGCVCFPVFADQHWEAALSLADLALYQSKLGGRNRATCVMQVAADADPALLAHDLARAEAAGAVELQTVLGPSPPMTTVQIKSPAGSALVPSHLRGPVLTGGR